MDQAELKFNIFQEMARQSSRLAPMLKDKLELLMKLLKSLQMEATTPPFKALPLVVIPRLLAHPLLHQDLDHLTPPSLPQAVAYHTLLSPPM
jgi:hypothetical protein